MDEELVFLEQDLDPIENIQTNYNFSPIVLSKLLLQIKSNHKSNRKC